MKTYTDGYLDCLLDIKQEIKDSRGILNYEAYNMTLKQLDTVLDEMIQDLRSL